MMCKSVFHAAALVIALCGSQSLAALIVEESFNSATATATGVSTTGSTGLDAGEWTFESRSRAGVGFSVQTGLTFSDLATSGGAVQVSDPTANTGFDGPLLHRGIDASATNTTLWGSYLFSRPAGIPPANQTIGEINTANGSIDGFGSARFRTLSEAFGPTPQVGMSLSGGAEALGAYPANYFTDPALFTDPLLIVSKITDVGGATGATTLATVWALNAAGFDSIKGGGVTEAELTSVAIATATDTTTISATHSFDATSFLRITTLRNGAWGVFDEIRYGVGADPTEAGILPTSQIPEPASIALLGCCLAGLGYRRMRAAQA